MPLLVIVPSREAIKEGKKDWVNNLASALKVAAGNTPRASAGLLMHFPAGQRLFVRLSGFLHQPHYVGAPRRSELVRLLAEHLGSAPAAPLGALRLLAAQPVKPLKAVLPRSLQRRIPCACP